MPNSNCGINHKPVNGKPSPTRDNSFRVSRIRNTIRRVSLCNQRKPALFGLMTTQPGPKQLMNCKNTFDQHVDFVIWRRFTKNVAPNFNCPN